MRHKGPRMCMNGGKKDGTARGTEERYGQEEECRKKDTMQIAMKTAAGPPR